ncbi:MAG TPA: glucose 1-dehydrogenase [Chloroflexota bacterium]
MAGLVQDQVAIVTGAGQGIGRAIALALARHGAHVVVADVNVETARQVADEVRHLERRALALQVDVTVKASVEEMVRATLDEFGRLDVMVANAGITHIAPSVEFREEDWDRVIAVDLKGVFLCCQAAGRVMVEQRRGCIVSTASMMGMMGLPGRPPYTAAKAGVINLTRTLACEWAPFGVRVNAVAPGYVRTEMVQRYVEGGRIRKEDLERRTPLGRLAEPDEIGKAVVFLASDLASYVTGHTLLVDGGYTAYGGYEYFGEPRR